MSSKVEEFDVHFEISSSEEGDAGCERDLHTGQYVRDGLGKWITFFISSVRLKHVLNN